MRNIIAFNDTVFSDKFVNEEIISSNEEIVLSSHRIRQYVESTSITTFKSFLLENITSCKVEKSITWKLLIIAILLGFLGFMGILKTDSMDYDNNAKEIFGITSVAIIFIALFFLIRFFLSYKRTLTISTSSDSITSSIAGLKFDDVVDFVNKIERIREERMITLNTIGKK